MANLCNRCEGIFYNAKRAFADPSVAEQYSWEFGCYQTLQQNAENSQCQLCCIIFSLKRQDAVDQLIQDGHQDELDYAFEFVNEDRDLFSIDVFPVKQINTRLFTSRVRLRKSGCEWPLLHRRVPLKILFSLAANISCDSLAKNSSDSAAETSTWSWRSVELVQDWLTKCLSDHAACSPVSAVNRLPLRFLDIDPADDIP